MLDATTILELDYVSDPSLARARPKGTATSHSRYIVPHQESFVRVGGRRRHRLVDWPFLELQSSTQSRDSTDLVELLADARWATVNTQSRRERMKARLRALKRLPPNHDNEGAAAPQAASVDAAIRFLSLMSCEHPYGVTLNDDGEAVIEFENRSANIFGDITFSADGETIECYFRSGGYPSELIAGRLGSEKMTAFLLERLGVLA